MYPLMPAADSDSKSASGLSPPICSDGESTDTCDIDGVAWTKSQITFWYATVAAAQSLRTRVPSLLWLGSFIPSRAMQTSAARSRMSARTAFSAGIDIDQSSGITVMTHLSPSARHCLMIVSLEARRFGEMLYFPRM